MREQQGPLSDIFAFGGVDLNVSADGQADVANGQAVSGNYYRGLGVQTAVGRLLTDEDDKASATPVAVLSHRYWQKRFSGDPAVIGKQINLNNLGFTVIGVSAKGFDGTMGVGTTQDVTIPVTMEPQLYVDKQRSYMSGPGVWWLRIMGRLKPGATAEQAQGQATRQRRTVRCEPARQRQRKRDACCIVERAFARRMAIDMRGQHDAIGTGSGQIENQGFGLRVRSEL